MVPGQTRFCIIVSGPAVVRDRFGGFRDSGCTLWAKLARTGPDGARFRTAHSPLPMNARLPAALASPALRAASNYYNSPCTQC